VGPQDFRGDGLAGIVGLLYFEEATGGTDELRAARRGGKEHLLQRGLLHRLSTGQQVAPWATRFAYPFC
jgi:hypothetical protein